MHTGLPSAPTCWETRPDGLTSPGLNFHIMSGAGQREQSLLHRPTTTLSQTPEPAPGHTVGEGEVNPNVRGWEFCSVDRADIGNVSVHADYPSVEAGRPEVTGHAWLHSKLGTNLAFMSQKTKQPTNVKP